VPEIPLASFSELISDFRFYRHRWAIIASESPIIYRPLPDGMAKLDTGLAAIKACSSLPTRKDPPSVAYA
jgi:hypothetical protein